MNRRLSPRHIRIFLSSPGDVADERALALKVIDQLPYDPLLRGKVTFEVVAWDKPGAGTPMLATMTPQEAINQGLPKPSECDIVVVIFWARMGTPLPHPDYKKPDGEPYWSGTEWEYDDAMQAARRFKRPEVVIYRRTDKVLFDPTDAEFARKYEQWQRVQAFFAPFTEPETGAIRQGYNSYTTPDHFRSEFETHLKVLVNRFLTEPVASALSAVTVTEAPAWEGSPFPGLRAFTEADAPIFFGRGRETDALVKRVSESRFVAVVGASGSGKSSLVGAGLIPRLRGNAIEGSKDWILPTWDAEDNQWRRLRFTPGEAGDNPFVALGLKLGPLVGEAARDVADKLFQDPEAIDTICEPLFVDRPAWVEALLFVDQLEELFTVVAEKYRQPFVDVLARLADVERVRTVVTMRSDFYQRCVEYEALAELLREGSFPLAAPKTAALYEMIARPAERAALVFEDGLPQQILDDTGSEPGSLALMAYLLDELYHARKDDGRLALAAYEVLGGVKGAIGRRAEGVYGDLNEDVQATLPRVFHLLVEVDERRTATRQRAALSQIATTRATSQLIDAFTAARLLVQYQGAGDAEPIVEVAHEALLRNWPRLADWIERTQDDLRLLRQVRNAARAWDERGCPDDFLWRGQQLQAAREMAERLQPALNTVEVDFLRPEVERLTEKLLNPNLNHYARQRLGDEFDLIGDTRPGVGLRPDGLPDIAWCFVPGGKVTIFHSTGVPLGTFRIRPFHISKYLITHKQFQAFLDAPDGISSAYLWSGFPEEYETQRVADQYRLHWNSPRDNVTWFQAVVFTRWLTKKLPSDGWPVRRGKNWQIRLPTEWEWQQAALESDLGKIYPWGDEWDDGRYCNSLEARLTRTTAVGLYPQGATQAGVMDMAGNLWEWCLNEARSLEIVMNSDDFRALRGGSYLSTEHEVRCVMRDFGKPYDTGLNGIRIICSSSRFW